MGKGKGQKRDLTRPQACGLANFHSVITLIISLVCILATPETHGATISESSIGENQYLKVLSRFDGAVIIFYLWYFGILDEV